MVGPFRYLLAFAISTCVAAGPATAPAPLVQTALEPIAQLAPGKTAGMWRLVYHGRAELALPGHCALLVTISEPFHDGITALHFSDAKEFTVEADLQPGTYSVAVSPGMENADYWPSMSQKIHIDKAGHLYQPHRASLTPGVFVLERRINAVSPANLAIADVKQPLFKWQAIPGATRYRGDFRPLPKVKWHVMPFDVAEAQYQTNGDLDGGLEYFWDVIAIDANGNTIARGQGSFFRQGITEVIAAKSRAEKIVPHFDPPMDEMPYLGIRLRPAQAPKDATTPMKYIESDANAAVDDASGFIPGVEVTDVLSFSPAADSDLHPEDVIIAVDGQPVQSENMGSRGAFTAHIRAMQPGQQIAPTVRRFPRELTLHATIGKFPGAGPTSQPAPNVPTTAPK